MGYKFYSENLKEGDHLKGYACRKVIERVSQELDYRIDICRVTKGAHIEHL
jgi:hypothetical protein